MPRFTVKDLLIATALVAAGAGMIGLLHHGRLLPDNVEFASAWATAILLWFGGGALIGAGLFLPFKRPWTGVVFALVIQTLLMALPL
jgi:hypothetical protein